MPLDRLLHPRLGQSRKVNTLTHLEFRVWAQYLLSSDDFGVMLCAAVTIQAGSEALAREPARKVMAALDHFVSLALVLRFVHQDRPYLCQGDWQDFQKITFPRQTTNPKPPEHIREQCSTTTRKLLDLHPGGKKVFQKNSENVPEVIPHNSENVSELISHPRVRETATATANGIRPTAKAYGGSLIQRGVAIQGGGSAGRPPVHPSQHEKLLARMCPINVGTEAEAAVEAELRAFYARIREEWANRDILPASDWKFWDARFDEWKPAPAKAKPDKFAGLTERAQAEFDRRQAARGAK